MAQIEGLISFDVIANSGIPIYHKKYDSEIREVDGPSFGYYVTALRDLFQFSFGENLVEIGTPKYQMFFFQSQSAVYIAILSNENRHKEDHAKCKDIYEFLEQIYRRLENNYDIGKEINYNSAIKQRDLLQQIQSFLDLAIIDTARDPKNEVKDQNTKSIESGEIRKLRLIINN